MLFSHSVLKGVYKLFVFVEGVFAQREHQVFHDDFLRLARVEVDDLADGLFRVYDH